MKELELQIQGSRVVLLHDHCALPAISALAKTTAGTVQIGEADDEEKLLIESKDRCVYLKGERRRTYLAQEIFLFRGGRVALVDPSLGPLLLFPGEPGLILGRMRLGLKSWLRFAQTHFKGPFPLVQIAVSLMLLLCALCGLLHVRSRAVALAPFLPLDARLVALNRASWSREFDDWRLQAQPPSEADMPSETKLVVETSSKHVGKQLNSELLPEERSPNAQQSSRLHETPKKGIKRRCPSDFLERQFVWGCSTGASK